MKWLLFIAWGLLVPIFCLSALIFAPKTHGALGLSVQVNGVNQTEIYQDGTYTLTLTNPDGTPYSGSLEVSLSFNGGSYSSPVPYNDPWGNPLQVVAGQLIINLLDWRNPQTGTLASVGSYTAIYRPSPNPASLPMSNPITIKVIPFNPSSYHEEFPIGRYGLSQPDDLTLSRSMANVALDYSLPGMINDPASLSRTIAVLDDAYQKRMKIILNMRIVIEHPELLNNLQTFIQQIKNHPALYGYYLSDEPESNPSIYTVTNIIQLNTLIKQSDSQHPTLIVFSSDMTNAKKFFGIADIAGFDIYPFMTSTDGTISMLSFYYQTLDQFIAFHNSLSVNNTKAYFMINQAFSSPNHRAPTQAEYMEIINNTFNKSSFFSGILFYTWTTSVSEYTPLKFLPNLQTTLTNIFDNYKNRASFFPVRLHTNPCPADLPYSHTETEQSTIDSYCNTAVGGCPAPSKWGSPISCHSAPGWQPFGAWCTNPYCTGCRCIPPTPTPTCVIPPAPTLISPKGSVSPGDQLFSWTNTGASAYFFRISPNGITCANPPADFCPGPIHAASYTYNVQAGKTYTWWAHAIGTRNGVEDTNCQSPYSSAVITVTNPTPTPKPGDYNLDGNVDYLDRLITFTLSPFSIFNFNLVVRHYGT